MKLLLLLSWWIITTTTTTTNGATIQLIAPPGDYVRLYISTLSKVIDSNDESGWNVGYTVNGELQPEFVAYSDMGSNEILSNTVEFLTPNLSVLHPIYLSFDRSGQNLSQYLDGVYPAFSGVDPYNAVNGSGYWFQPQMYRTKLQGAGNGFYYQCRNHAHMGFHIEVRNYGMCDYWIDIEGIRGGELTDPILEETLGIVANDAETGLDAYLGLGYPNIDYSSNVTAFNSLLLAYKQFFYVNVLECHALAPDYEDWTGPSLQEIHQLIDIGFAEWTAWFSAYIASDASSYDWPVQPLHYQSKRYFIPWMSQVCNQPDCHASICDSWSNLNFPDRRTFGYKNDGENVEWLGNVLTQMLSIIDSDGNMTALRNVFVDHLLLGDDQSNVGAWITAMTSYLGTLLNCSNTDFVPYTGSSLAVIHTAMDISQSIWENHLIALLRAFTYYEVHWRDVDRIEQILRSETTMDGSCNDENTCHNLVNGEVFVFTVDEKTEQHPFFGEGYDRGYFVNGIEAPELNLTVDLTYIFRNDANCGQPLFISTNINGSSVGVPLGIVTTGIVSPGLYSVCNGGELYWTPQQSQVDSTFYYQCSIHREMGFRINILGAAPTPEPEPTPEPGPDTSTIDLTSPLESRITILRHEISNMRITWALTVIVGTTFIMFLLILFIFISN